MPTIRQLNQDLEVTKSLLTITESLGEVAAIKFRTTHRQIQHNTSYFQEVARLYKLLKLISTKRRLLSKNASAPKANSGTVSLLLTSNYQFYGGLDSQLSHFFTASTLKYKTDMVVVGRTGLEFLESLKFDKPYQKVIHSSDNPSHSELNKLVELIKPYERILVYHSKFVTILDQEAEISELGNEDLEKEAGKLEFDYILEPELDKMLNFFENQILSSRLDALFLQSALARTAARMVGMDQAQMNAEKKVGQQKALIIKQKKHLQNLRILETFTGLRALKEQENYG